MSAATEPGSLPAGAWKQALRLRRFLLASTTCAVGLSILAMCAAFDLLPPRLLGGVGLAFLAVNLTIGLAMDSAQNEAAA